MLRQNKKWKLALPLLVVTGLLFCGCTHGPIKTIGHKPFVMTTVGCNYFNAMLRFGPVADDLSKILAKPVRVSCDWDAQSIQVHLRDRADYYNLLYLNPVDYCLVSKTSPLRPIAVRTNLNNSTSEVGLIVVPKDSPIRSVSDLRGKRFAFGPYKSAYQFYNVLELFKASKMPTAMLKDVSYCNDSLSAVRKILLNWADAGVVTETWWKTTKDKTLDFSRLLKDDLRIIAKTKPTPEYVWAVTGSVDAGQVKELTSFLTGTINGKSKLLAGFGASKFTPVNLKALSAYCRRLAKIKNLPAKPILMPLK